MEGPGACKINPVKEGDKLIGQEHGKTEDFDLEACKQEAIKGCPWTPRGDGHPSAAQHFFQPALAGELKAHLKEASLDFYSR